jgi:hypothetical protein
MAARSVPRIRDGSAPRICGPIGGCAAATAGQRAAPASRASKLKPTAGDARQRCRRPCSFDRVVPGLPASGRAGPRGDGRTVRRRNYRAGLGGKAGLRPVRRPSGQHGGERPATAVKKPARRSSYPSLATPRKVDSRIRRPPAGIPHGRFERECFCQFHSDGILLWSKFTRQRGPLPRPVGAAGYRLTSSEPGSRRRQATDFAPILESASIDRR